jgi:hypothetical protein
VTPKCLPLVQDNWLTNEQSPARISPRSGSKEDRAPNVRKQECPRGSYATKEAFMNVMIGIDPPQGIAHGGGHWPG